MTGLGVRVPEFHVRETRARVSITFFRMRPPPSLLRGTRTGLRATRRRVRERRRRVRETRRRVWERRRRVRETRRRV
jgi:hypothetical protein